MKTDKIMTMVFLLVLACFLSLGCDQLRGEDGVDGLGTPGPDGAQGPAGIPCETAGCVTSWDIQNGGVTREDLESGFTVDGSMLTPLSVSGGDTGNIGFYTVDTINIADSAITHHWVADGNVSLYGDTMYFWPNGNWQEIPDMTLNIMASDPSLGGHQSIIFEGTFMIDGSDFIPTVQTVVLGLYIDDLPVKTSFFQSTLVVTLDNGGDVGFGFGYPLTQRVVLWDGSLPTGNHNVKVKIFNQPTNILKVISYAAVLGSRTLVVHDYAR